MKKRTLSDLDMPAYLLNCPLSVSSNQPNNKWMTDALAKGEDITIDVDDAVGQWYDLYSILSANGIVQLLPTPTFKTGELQDLVYVANMGICLNLPKGRNVIVVSNFTSPPRQAETAVGEYFFKGMGYDEVVVCTYKFEGEADLKHIRDNIYIGGYGMRTDIRAFIWMEEKFNIQIIKVKITNPNLYHFDCSLFPMSKEVVIFDGLNFTKDEMDEVKRVVEVIPVKNQSLLDYGMTNMCRVGSLILVGSDLHDLDTSIPEEREAYKIEREKINFLEDVCMELSLELNPVNLSVFYSSGAALSCNVMHLNRVSYNVDMI